MITSRKVTALTALTPRSEENARKTRLAHKAATFAKVAALTLGSEAGSALLHDPRREFGDGLRELVLREL
jgi:hypothetical protein